MEFKYEIGGRTFYQRPLVLGQVKQLVSILKELVLPYELTVASVILSLGDKTSNALAVLMVEEGVPLKKKKMAEIEDILEENLSIEETIKVVEDFFDCNPIVSISEAMIGLTNKVQKTMTQANSLTESVLSSQGEILPEEMTSSGDTLLENVNPT
jgi:hypothetical protein